MAPKVMSFRRADGHWFQVTVDRRRVERVTGAKSGVANAASFTVFQSPTAAELGFRKHCRAAWDDRFRTVSRVAKFKPLPPDQWVDTAKAPQPKPAKRAPLPAPLEARVAQLERTPGVVVKVKRGKPATPKALAAAEQQLGRALPASLKTFLGAHDGLTIEWKNEAHGWGVAFEVWSLREMLKEWKFRGAYIARKDGLLLPIAPTFGRPVIGAVLRDKGEAKIIEWTDPPDGKVYALGPSFAAYVEKAVKTYFVVTSGHDVSHKWLPAIRKVVGKG